MSSAAERLHVFKKQKIYHHETLICSQKIYARYTLIFARIEEMQNSQRQRLYLFLLVNGNSGQSRGYGLAFDLW